MVACFSEGQLGLVKAIVDMGLAGVPSSLDLLFVG